MSLPVTPALLALLAERRIFDAAYAGRRWRVGEQLVAMPGCALEPYCQVHAGHALPLSMGAFSYTNSPIAITTTTIGRYCSIAQRVLWMGPSHPTDRLTSSSFTFDKRGLQGVRSYLVDVKAPLPFKLEPYEVYAQPGVAIEHDVWIGHEAALKDGVRIGTGAVVGARAVVTRDVPPYAVVVGSPARVVKLRFPEPLVEALLASEWWRYGPDVLREADFMRPDGFAERLGELVSQGAKPLDLAPVTYEEMRAAAQAATA